MEGRHDECRPGQTRTYEDVMVADVIDRALLAGPIDGSTPWSTKTYLAGTGTSEPRVYSYRKPAATSSQLDRFLLRSLAIWSGVN